MRSLIGARPGLRTVTGAPTGKEEIMFKQTQSKSRFLAMLLALIMCLGMMPGTAWGQLLGECEHRGWRSGMVCPIQITGA